jgi:lipopolysaccharide/colanic/teichoic acid biosynthesis glycosyltransferase
VGSAPQFRIVGHPREVQAIAAERLADLLIAVPSALSWESQQVVASLAERSDSAIEVRLAPTHYDLHAAQVEPAPLGFVPLVRVHSARLIGLDAVLRALLDVTLAGLLLLITAPVLAIMLARAWLRGVRPLLVSQRVLGRGGEPITLQVLNPEVTQRLLLRGVPALIAVLRGQLALVGPRPVPVEQREAYQRWEGLLLSVPPGLTGPWRLVPCEEAPEERVLADIWWVRNWSIWQHLFVLTKTVHALWGGARRDREVQRWALTVPRRGEGAPA